jgi:hypothetical protein
LPAKDDSTFGNEAVGQLVPSHHLFAFAAYIFAYPLHEVTLKVLFMGEVLFLHTFLAEGTLFPVGFLGFIVD